MAVGDLQLGDEKVTLNHLVYSVNSIVACIMKNINQHFEQLVSWMLWVDLDQIDPNLGEIDWQDFLQCEGSSHKIGSLEPRVLFSCKFGSVFVGVSSPRLLFFFQETHEDDYFGCLE